MGAILVPGNKAAITRLLGVDMGGPNHQVIPQDSAHQVKNCRVPHESVEPGKHKMRLVAPLAIDRTARIGFVDFEFSEVVGRVGGTHHTPRKNQARVVVLRDLIGRNRHGDLLR